MLPPGSAPGSLSNCLKWLMLLTLSISTILTPSLARAQNLPNPTEVIILGVEHAAQLVNRRQQPAAMRALFAELAPDAICIERAPEQFARADHYEFTYEIQSVIVPWAKQTGTDLCPFDWLPAAEDTRLVFGVDNLEHVPLLRRDNGFQGFLSFPFERTMSQGLFFADSEEERAKHRLFYTDYPDQPVQDGARRLFLYRTMMQAQRISAAARAHPGGRILVVVGAMHKDDIERTLADHGHIVVRQPSKIANEPGSDAIARATRIDDLFAIAYFNLLGTQAAAGNVDWPWLNEVTDFLKRRRPGPEADLLLTRFRAITGMIDEQAALSSYLAIGRDERCNGFTWTGIKDLSRLDSVYDPFAALCVRNRALLEAAKIQYVIGQYERAEANRLLIQGTLKSETQRLQFTAYWNRYVRPSAP